LSDLIESNIEGNSAALIEQWARDIPLYLKEQLQLKYPIWDGQEKIVAAVPMAIKEHKPIFCGSGHAMGKDFIGGCIANWGLDTMVPSKVILTAPTDRQVKHIMWAETLARYNGKLIKYGKVFESPYIEIRKEDWFLMGFTTKDSGTAGGGKFQGIRSANNMIIIATEAQSIEDGIKDQIDGILAGVENWLLLVLGNPTRKDGWFAKGLKDKKNNIVFNFSCLDSPNYKTGTTVIPGLVGKAWVDDKLKRWGPTDPRYMSRVLGQLPATSLNEMFPEEVMNKMKARHGFLARFSFNRGLAIDSAGEGIDDNVFMAGSGGEVTKVYTTATIAPSVAAVKAVEMCKEIMGSWIIVDCDGIGIAVWQELMKLSKDYLGGIQIIKFHGSSQDVEQLDTGGRHRDEKKRIYHNRRAEAAFVAKDRGFRGVAAVNIEDDYLCAELEADEWFENKSGQIQLIEKEDIKDKLDPPRSPGRADCWKMLQWGFEQNYVELVYQPQNSQMQTVADSDMSINQGQSHGEAGQLQQYAD
jgi:microcompartment protein CcmK/EutM